MVVGEEVKILYVGAPSPHMEKFARTFAGRHEVHCAVFKSGGMPNEIILRSKSKLTRWTPSVAAPLLKRAIKEVEPDLVHAFYLLPYAYLAARAGARPLVVSAMGDDIYKPDARSRIAARALHLTRVPRDWHRAIAGAFSRAVVECAHAKNRMVELGYPGDRIDVVTWGPDCRSFRPEARDLALRTRLLGTASSVVICTRAWWKEYGIQDLLRGFDSADAGRSARLVLLGGGPERSALRRLATRLKIADRVEFVGAVPPADVARYAACADIMVSPSYSDTVSVSLLEGMACELPVVATDVGGTSEFVRDGENGLLVPPRRPDLLGKAMTQLLADPALRARLGRRARATVLDKADWSRRAAEVERMYAGLVGL